MTLDDQGRSDVFAFLASNGYTGTQDQWWASVREQSYYSGIRMFCSYAVPSLGPEHAAAQAFLRRLCAVAQRHFNSWRNDAGCYPEMGISFNRSEARRQEIPLRPLRLDGLYVDVNCRDRSGAVEIRCRLYVNGEFRRDRYFDFTPDFPKKRGTQ